jgi:hypothetical protein
MSRCASVSLASYVSLLFFSINYGSSVGNLTFMLSLYSLEFRFVEFIFMKLCIDILRHLWMTESLHCCVMGSPPNMGRGPQGSHSARSEP